MTAPTSTRRLHFFARHLRREAVALDQLRATLQLPPEPELEAIYDDPDALVNAPEVELDMHLEGLGVSARRLAWQAERLILGLPPALQPGEPDPGIGWPPPAGIASSL
jgi:hypothetical protein